MLCQRDKYIKPPRKYSVVDYGRATKVMLR